MLFALLFLVLILFLLFKIKPKNFKNPISSFRENMIKPSLISNYAGFDEIKWLCAFTKYTKIHIKAIIYINELILTPFSTLDTKYKKT